MITTSNKNENATGNTVSSTSVPPDIKPALLATPPAAGSKKGGGHSTKVPFRGNLKFAETASEVLVVFNVAMPRRYLRIGLFVWKWMLLPMFSASVMPFLRSNFGRDYAFTLLGAPCCYFAFCWWVTFFLLISAPPLSSVLFASSLLVLCIFHRVYTRRRHRRLLGEPYRLFAGDSWGIWRFLGFPEKTVHCILEPALCLVAALCLFRADRFLGCWLFVSAGALFLKPYRFQIARKILVLIDAKIEPHRLIVFQSRSLQKTGQSKQQPH